MSVILKDGPKPAPVQPTVYEVELVPLGDSVKVEVTRTGGGKPSLTQIVAHLTQKDSGGFKVTPIGNCFVTKEIFNEE